MNYKTFTTKFDKSIALSSSPFVVEPTDFGSIEVINFRSLWRILHDSPQILRLSPVHHLPHPRVRVVIDRSLSLIKHQSLVITFINVISSFVTSFELIGYTTRHWLGGNSYLAWKSSNLPNPGRVNDILYLTCECNGPNTNLQSFMCKSIMKENIDGEALFSLCLTSKPIILLCDNNPSDYRTNSLNNSPLLKNHFKEAQASTQNMLKVNIGSTTTPSNWYNLSKTTSRLSINQLITNLSTFLSTST
ncbi:MAG: cobaltochelatase CobT-related protein [Candidatus Hodgkinia cicadicola]